jgi:hypothetical protein
MREEVNSLYWLEESTSEEPEITVEFVDDVDEAGVETKREGAALTETRPDLPAFLKIGTALSVAFLIAACIVTGPQLYQALWHEGESEVTQTSEREARAMDQTTKRQAPKSSSSGGAPSERELTLSKVEINSNEKPPSAPPIPTSIAPKKPARAPEPSRATPPTGDLAVMVPQGVTVYLGELLLGKGNFNTTLVAGDYKLRLQPSEGPVSFVRAKVQPGAMSVITIRE